MHGIAEIKKLNEGATEPRRISDAERVRIERDKAINVLKQIRDRRYTGELHLFVIAELEKLGVKTKDFTK